MARSTSPFQPSRGKARSAGNTPELDDWGEPNGLVQGNRILNYEIGRRLGVGSTGAVYLARDHDLNRTVALKILRAEFLTDDDTEQAWERRVRSAARISSAHVAAIYDVVRESRPPRLCLVMQYVPGQAIFSELHDRETLIELFIQACEGLSAAHKIAVVHGRLTPDKLLVAKGPPPHLEIIGFDSIADARLELRARPRLALRSPIYMSPEQVSGQAVDARTDLWSLGVIMYEALSGGHLPFDAPTVMGLAARVLAGRYPSLREFGVPAGLAEIVDRCLFKDRDARYATASELADDLRALNRDSLCKADAVESSNPFRLQPVAERTSRAFSWLRRIARLFEQDATDEPSGGPDESREIEDSRRSDELVTQSYLGAMVRSLDDSRLLLDRLIESSSRLRDRMAVAAEDRGYLGE